MARCLCRPGVCCRSGMLCSASLSHAHVGAVAGSGAAVMHCTRRAGGACTTKRAHAALHSFRLYKHRHGLPIYRCPRPPPLSSLLAARRRSRGDACAVVRATMPYEQVHVVGGNSGRCKCLTKNVCGDPVAVQFVAALQPCSVSKLHLHLPNVRCQFACPPPLAFSSVICSRHVCNMCCRAA